MYSTIIVHIFQVKTTCDKSVAHSLSAQNILSVHCNTRAAKYVQRPVVCPPLNSPLRYGSCVWDKHVNKANGQRSNWLRPQHMLRTFTRTSSPYNPLDVVVQIDLFGVFLSRKSLYFSQAPASSEISDLIRDFTWQAKRNFWPIFVYQLFCF